MQRAGKRIGDGAMEWREEGKETEGVLGRAQSGPDRIRIVLRKSTEISLSAGSLSVE